MTFDATETSLESGRPIELYTFMIGTTETFRYTSHDEEVVFGGQTYEVVQIERGQVQASKEDEINAIDITLPSDNEFASEFIGIIPGDPSTVQIVKTHQQEIGG